MLSDHQISLAKGMLLRGDDQHHIAALFGLNAGRIAEIANGMKDKPGSVQRGAEIAAAPASELPPPGPYFLNFVSERDIVLDGLEAAVAAVADYVANNSGEAARDMQRRFHSAIAERKRELYKGRLK